MYLVTQSKNGISAMGLKRQLGVSYNTAWSVKHKLMQAMRELDDSQPLQGTVELDDAYLGGEASGGKRGRGAAGKTPFVAAATAAPEPGGRLSGDAGCGCEHQPRVTGGGKGSCETPGLTWVNTLLGNVKRAIDGTYHACDPQYVGATSPSSPTASSGATSWPISSPGSPISRRVPLRCLTAS